MVFTFFDKNSRGSGIKSMPNQQLTHKLQKPIIKKFKKIKVYSSLKDNICDVDLADMQLISNYNKGIRFLLCVINLFSKYAWVVPLKNKQKVTIVNAFQSILDSSKRQPKKVWLNQGNEFYNSHLKKLLEDMSTIIHTIELLK